MASRKDNHKVMDMLEKMGMVNKIEDDDAFAGLTKSIVSVQTPDISISDPPAPKPPVPAPAPRQESPPPVRPAPRQDPPPPVRPMPRQDPPPPIRPVPRQEMIPPIVRPAPRQESPPPRPPVPVPPPRQDISAPKTERTFELSDMVLGKSFWDNDLLEADSGPSADDFTEISELYRRFNLKTSGLDTVYLLEDYVRTLPESLPPEMRRSIVLQIVTASGFDFDKLLNDGIDRVSRLNEYSATFASHTEEILARYNDEIDALQRQIEGIRETINERKNLHKRQFLEIEGEAQRLKDILDFVTK